MARGESGGLKKSFHPFESDTLKLISFLKGRFMSQKPNVPYLAYYTSKKIPVSKIMTESEYASIDTLFDGKPHFFPYEKYVEREQSRLSMQPKATLSVSSIVITGVKDVDDKKIKTVEDDPDFVEWVTK